MTKKKFSANEIIQQIRAVNQIFRESRKYYPYIADKHIGDKPTLKFNLMGETILLTYDEPITKEFQEYNNKIAHFLNQNFLLRLYSVLNEYNIFPQIDKDKNPELYVLKRLRNVFGHSLGEFDKTEEDDRNLMKHIIKTFHLEDKEYIDFPIPIDKVMGKIISASIQHIKDNF